MNTMDNNKLTITASPHVFDNLSTSKMMYGVCLALIPAVIASVIFFGWKAMALIVVSIVSCVLCEGFFQKVRKRKLSINDGSAFLTGLLLAMIIPRTKKLSGRFNYPVWRFGSRLLACFLLCTFFRLLWLGVGVFLISCLALCG